MLLAAVIRAGGASAVAANTHENLAMSDCRPLAGDRETVTDDRGD
jgi:hypothetical protein